MKLFDKNLEQVKESIRTILSFMEKDPELLSLLQELVRKIQAHEDQRTPQKRKVDKDDPKPDPFDLYQTQGKKRLVEYLNSVARKHIHRIAKDALAGGRFNLPNGGISHMTKAELITFVVNSVETGQPQPSEDPARASKATIGGRQPSPVRTDELMKLDEDDLRRLIKDKGIDPYRESKKLKTEKELVDFILRRERRVRDKGTVFRSKF